MGLDVRNAEEQVSRNLYICTEHGNGTSSVHCMCEENQFQKRIITHPLTSTYLHKFCNACDMTSLKKKFQSKIGFLFFFFLSLCKMIMTQQ